MPTWNYTRTRGSDMVASMIDRLKDTTPMARLSLALVAAVMCLPTPKSGRRTPPRATNTSTRSRSVATEDGTSWKWTPRTGRLYVTRGTRVVVVDLDTEKVVGEIADTPGVHGIAFVPDLNRGFTSNGGDSTVTVFDLKTLKTLGQGQGQR